MRKTTTAFPHLPTRAPLLFHHRIPIRQTLVLIVFPMFGCVSALIGGVFDIRTLFLSIRDDAEERVAMNLTQHFAQMT